MTRFSFDTSAFIEPWNRHYPMDVSPSLWERLDNLARNGIIAAQKAVYWEIEEKQDSLFEWARARQHVFSEPSADVQIAVRRILRAHPRLIGASRNRSGADPWVIAQAIDIDGAVVTYEQWDPQRKKVKIPDVCQSLGIRCLTFTDFLRECGIKLRAE